MTATDVAIHHLDCRYTVPRGAGSGDSIRSRLDQVAARLLPSALANQPQPLPLEDGAIYFVERLEIALSVQADLNDYDVARTWAASLWNGLSERLCHAEGVVVFRSRAKFLSAFLLDLAAGLAESVWYYRRLLEPAGLSSGARAERLLIEDPDTGRDALIETHRQGRLEELLSILENAQIAEVVRRCLLPPSPEVVSAAGCRRWKKALLAVLASRRFVASSSPARDTLLLYLEILRAQPDLGPDVNLARFVWRSLELRSTCLRLPELQALIRSGDWERARPLLGSVEQARFLASLMQALPAQEIAAILERLEPEAADAFERQFLTEHAGAFLLASSALEIEQWEKIGPLALYLTVLQCLGAPHLAQTAIDPGVAVFCGLDKPPSPNELAAQLSAWTPPPVAGDVRDPWFSLRAPGGPLHDFPDIDAFLQPISQGLLRRFLLRLGAFADSTPEYAYATFLHCRGVVSLSGGRISVQYLTCPLRAVLRMAGFGSSPAALPWAGGKLLEIDLD